MIDLLLIAVLAAVIWCVGSEGAFGAGICLLSVIFAGLIAMNFFEPLAMLLESSLGGWIKPRADFLALVGLFGIFVFLFRLGTDQIAPSTIELHPLILQGGRWLFAGLTGYVTMAFLLTALHTAPLPRNFLGFTPEGKNFLRMAAPDRQWLGFTQHATEVVFPHGRVFDTQKYVMPDGKPRYLSTFILRYASRRESGGGGATIGGAGGSGIRSITPSGGGAAPPPSGF